MWYWGKVFSNEQNQAKSWVVNGGVTKEISKGGSRIQGQIGWGVKGKIVHETQIWQWEKNVEGWTWQWTIVYKG